MGWKMVVVLITAGNFCAADGIGAPFLRQR